MLVKIMEKYISPHMCGKNTKEFEKNLWLSQNPMYKYELEVSWEKYSRKNSKIVFDCGSRPRQQEDCRIESEFFMYIFICFLSTMHNEFKLASGLKLNLKETNAFLGFKTYSKNYKQTIENFLLIHKRELIFNFFYVLGSIKLDLMDSEKEDLFLFEASEPLQFFSTKQIEEMYKKLNIPFKKKDYNQLINDLVFSFSVCGGAIQRKRYKNSHGIVLYHERWSLFFHQLLKCLLVIEHKNYKRLN